LSGAIGFTSSTVTGWKKKVMSQHPLLADYLTAAEAAAELHVCVRTLARWRAMGEGPQKVRTGKKILYHRDDILNWLESQRNSGKSGADRG
jgi:hypothetical protein